MGAYMSNQILPASLQNVIDELGRLPGVGPRTAERYAFALLKGTKQQASQLAQVVNNLHDQLKTCPVTFMLIDAEADISPIYQDSDRDRTQVAVVEDPLDVVALEKTASFNGTYHVLGGVISPIDGVGPEQLHIKELIKRIKKDKVKEIILATNASIEGESTALYVQKQITQAAKDISISRIARGIPAGIDIEYADQITLSRALEGRQLL